MSASFDPSAFLGRLQQAWQQEDWATLSEMYHPKAVLLPPDLGQSLVGREAILATYQEFAAAATLHRFESTSMECHPFSACRVVHSGFVADYSVSERRCTDSGTEVYVVESGTDDQPVIVWRQQIIQSTRTTES